MCVQNLVVLDATCNLVGFCIFQARQMLVLLEPVLLVVSSLVSSSSSRARRKRVLN